MKHLESVASAAIVSALMALGSLSVRAQHYPTVQTNRTLKSGHSVTITDVPIMAHDDGSGESLADSLWIECTRSYLSAFRDAVRRLAHGQDFLTAEQKTELLRRMATFCRSAKGRWLWLVATLTRVWVS